MTDLLSSLQTSGIIDLIGSPSFKTLQYAVIIYFGLLWLSIIIWVTRDAILRSNSIAFQVISILINIFFPILGVLLYLIIRPTKTTLERYYEDLEHRLIMESIKAESPSRRKTTEAIKMKHKKIGRKKA
jgi:hypothetical protein